MPVESLSHARGAICTNYSETLVRGGGGGGEPFFFFLLPHDDDTLSWMGRISESSEPRVTASASQWVQPLACLKTPARNDLGRSIPGKQAAVEWCVYSL